MFTKVVLLAAGRSIRMQPIPDKNFLKFLGKPLIQHQIETLIEGKFSEILIVGGAHNMKRLESLTKELHFKNVKITVKEQKKLDLGMAGALLTAKNWISGDPFIIVSSNDILDISAYKSFLKNIKQTEGLLLAYRVKEYFPGGYLKVNSSNAIKEIVEKPTPGRQPSKLVNIVMHYHPEPKILFEALKKETENRKQKAGMDDIYERALQHLLDKKIVYRAVPFSGFWQAIKYPWHVFKVMKYFLGPPTPRLRQGCVGLRGVNNVQIAKTAVIKGDVYFEKGVKVLENAVIQGPAYIGANTVIATNTLVRESHIGANCVIGFGSEVARSYIGDNVFLHTNYVGDSIIGNDVSFGAGSVTGNLRFDEKNVFVSIKGEKVDSGMNKLGLITGDHIRTGINASFMPGVKIASNSCIGAGLVIAQDIPEHSFVAGETNLKMYENKVKITPAKLRLKAQFRGLSHETLLHHR